jgi:chemotaxis protein CheC
MIRLTAAQQGALVEQLQIGFGRAGAAVSQLTGRRVLLEVPEVSLHALDQLRPV